MIPGLRRRLAARACRVLESALPPRLRPWGEAVAAEVAGIADDGKALSFAIGSLCGLLPRALGGQLVRAANALIGNHASKGISAMGMSTAIWGPRAIGIACASGALALGLAYMAAAGAPLAYLGINAAALMIGILMIASLDMVEAGRIWAVRHGPGVLLTLLSLMLLATALLGTRVEGAARWISLGGLSIQPSLILLPAMIVAFARSRDSLSALAMAIAAAALALQPDRAMAGMLAAGLAVPAVLRPNRAALAALAAGMICFAISLIRSDLLPPTAYVDQILYTAFDVHLLAGWAVLGGSALLIVPAIIGVRHDPAHRAIHGAFGMVWLAAVAAAALGNYPTPVVGYGGSAILGFVLSLAIVPGRSRAVAVQPVRETGPELQPSDRQLYAAGSGARWSIGRPAPCSST